MDLYKQFATDQRAEKEGLVLNYGKNSRGEDIEIRIARAGGSNLKYTKLLDRKTKPYRRQIQTDTLDEESAVKIQREVYAEAVIIGWKGVLDDKGMPLPFNRDNCLKLLTDLPDLFAEIREQSTKAALFRVEIQEEEAKNS